MMAGTVHDVALVFEGGGMRNSYSAGAISVMLEQGLFFDDVYGLSAGATNAIDYVSRDARRNEASFTACLDDLLFRWWVMLFVDADGVGAALHGDARVLSSCALPFDFDAFQASYPIVLPPTVVDGRARYDGGIGRGGGIMVPRAMDDGLSRFFVVCTRPRGFRRPLKPNRFYDAFFWRRPRMREALDTWNRRYDAELDRLDRLEAEGRAYVFYANDQGVKNTERDAEKLARNYERGRMQALSEFDKWERFLSGQGV